MIPYIASIQVGKPKEIDKSNDPWTSGFFKEPVDNKVLLTKINLDGDGQADLVNHGGENKAVLAYSADHYSDWKNELNNPNLPYGAFGENFTIFGLQEKDVCIGDVYIIGDDIIVQVSQPRRPCWKISRRWNIKDLTKQVLDSLRTGWYFRVLKEGYVIKESPVRLIERPHPELTVQIANEIMHKRKIDAHILKELVECPSLADNWQDDFKKLLHSHNQ
ncbi:MAG: MOSC domain-containing protein [Spirochaetota bacterium]|nr:MOSC domain-containing protein [Spirochaetota bacterium]